MSKMLNLTYCPQCSSSLVCTLKIRRFGVKYHSVFLRVVRKTLLKSHSGITHQKRLMSNKLFIFQLPNFMAVSKGGTGTRNLGRGTWDVRPGKWELGRGSLRAPRLRVPRLRVLRLRVPRLRVTRPSPHVPVPLLVTACCELTLKTLSRSRLLWKTYKLRR